MRARDRGARIFAKVARYALTLAGTPVVLTPVVLSTLACGPSEQSTDIRQWTDDLALRISVSPLPPVAEGITTFKIVVKDKESGQPIETGAGRLYGRNVEGATVANGLAKGKEIGTYYAHVRFPVSGEWSIAMQIRRDSTKRLETIQDWRQMVDAAPPMGRRPQSPDSASNR